MSVFGIWAIDVRKNVAVEDFWASAALRCDLRYIKRLPEVFSLLEAFLFVRVFSQTLFSKKIFFQIAGKIFARSGLGQVHVVFLSCAR